MAQQLSCGLCRHGGSESGQVNAASGTASLIFVRVGFLAVAGHRLGVVDLSSIPSPTGVGIGGPMAKAATDVAGLAQRDGEVVFTELVEHLKDGADFANTFVVATEGEKRISTSLIPAPDIPRPGRCQGGSRRWSRS